MIDNTENKTIEMRGISKYFPGVMALKNVNLVIKSGEIHALVGENGAGKSTFLNIIGGLFQQDEGEISLNNSQIIIDSPKKAELLGISIIHQELPLIGELNIAQNIFLGREKTNKLGFNKKKVMNNEAHSLLGNLGVDINVNKLVNELPVGEKQLIEITKSLYSNSWLIIMDEPTSAISKAEKDRLFEVIKKLKKRGAAIIYVSHILREVFEIADRITVLRNGENKGTFHISEITEKEVIRLMVGETFENIFRRDKAKIGNEVLEVKNLTKINSFKNISFKVRSGEVLGLSGLVGAGRTEIARCLFGLDRLNSGEIFINGSKVKINSPSDAIYLGIGFVSEDRRKEGIIGVMSVKDNMILPSLPYISKFGWIKKREEENIYDDWVKILQIKTPTSYQKIMNLSGGNQQKVVLGKWLARNPKILILDEPTRGIDIGAKKEIHKIIGDLVKNGIAIILISSEIPEIIGACDRVIALYKGNIVKEFANSDLNEEILYSSISNFQ